MRLLANLIMRVEPGALLGDLADQHQVFKTYWPLASAHSFRAAEPPPLVPSAPGAAAQTVYQAPVDEHA